MISSLRRTVPSSLSVAHPVGGGQIALPADVMIEEFVADIWSRLRSGELR